ncbi:MAG: hypothetical protein E7049_11480 [Lentisphaerae bacterium]|jgi:hypothetical protein|nr:hypothetical protein [Lentisphaerota bacterium]
MSITLSAPPAVVQDVRIYAERHSTSLNAIIREHLEKIAALERKLRREGAEQLADFFESEKDWFDDAVTFDRELANAR